MKKLSRIELHRREMVIRNSKTLKQAAERIGVSAAYVSQMCDKYNFTTSADRKRERQRKVFLKCDNPKTAASRLGIPVSAIYGIASRLGVVLRRGFHPSVGGVAERRVLGILKKLGFQPEIQGYLDPWDINCGAVRIEVKGATFSRGGWIMNLHHGGKLNEKCDIYIFRLEACPFFKNAVHLVIPAPLKRKTVWISPRSLMTRWGRWYNRFDLITEAIQRKSSERAA